MSAADASSDDSESEEGYWDKTDLKVCVPHA